MNSLRQPLPPEKFRPANDVKWAKQLEGKPGFITRGRARGRFAVGIRYEKSGQEWLELAALRRKLHYDNGPWFEFGTDTGKRWCQPDALVVDKARKQILIVEFKYQHTSDAWFQLRQLYLPVVKAAYPGWTFGLVEVVHYFDPSTLWPERVNCVATLDQCFGAGETVATLIFNKRREHRFLGVGRSGDKGGSEEIGTSGFEEGSSGFPSPVGFRT